MKVLIWEALSEDQKNLSYTLGVPLYAVYFDSTGRLSNKEQEQLNKNISMAYRLGVFVIRSTGENWVSSMLDVIRIEKITHLNFRETSERKIYKANFQTKRTGSSYL